MLEFLLSRTPASSWTRRAIGRAVLATVQPALRCGPDRHLHRTRHVERLCSGDDRAKFDEPSRIAKIPVEKGQVAPRGVVGQVAWRWVDSGGRAFDRKSSRQIADLLGRVVVFQ